MLEGLLGLVLFLLAATSMVAWSARKSLRERQREDYIRTYTFPKGLIERLMKRRPDLAAKDAQLVARALRQFFLAHHKSGCQFIAMPSQAADDLWHEFILYTRHYQDFCQQAFGSFMHHTPAVVLAADQRDNTGLRRCWQLCCREENINPAKATRLPLLFALDTKLGIADGFHYVPDCSALRKTQDGGTPVHCGGDLSDSGGSSDGGSSGGDGSGHGGHGGHGGNDGGSDGGGGGGSGCGGGCGGGGGGD